MKDFKNKYGDWALLIGAAAGIGEAFAFQLASMGINLVVLDKNQTALNALNEKLVREFKIEVKTLHLNLIDTKLSPLILDTISNLNCRLLIYNAAYSVIKKFPEHSSEDLENYIQVNMASELRLTHAFSKFLIDKGQGGGILLMSSLAGLLGMQFIAPYAASKAFTCNLAEGLHHELKPYDIQVSACIAGATSSRTYLNTRPNYGKIKPQVQKPEEVADFALRKLGTRAFYISGFSNRLNYFILTRILPRKVAARMANRVIANMYDYV